MAGEDLFGEFGETGEALVQGLPKEAGYDVGGGSVPGTDTLNLPQQGFWDKAMGGITDVGGKLWDKFAADPAKGIMGGLGAGTGILGAWNAWKQAQNSGKQQGQLNEAEKGMGRMGAAGSTAASSLITAGAGAMEGGPLPAGLQAEADMWKADAQQRVRSYASKAGISDSTMMVTMENQINMQYDILKEKLAESLLAGGNTTETAAMGALSGQATTAQAQLNSADAAIAAAYKSLATLMGQTGSPDEEKKTA
jgi:hypothetical protein